MSTRTYRALLVANSTFPSDPHNLPELEGPRNDPALLRDALCDRDAGLVPSDNVRLVTERTMAEVLREVEDFLRSAARNDTLILYYSGHGVLDQSNELFLCTRDTRTDRLRSTAVKASDIKQMIDESSAATTVILLDCCHSGRFKGGDVPGTLSGRGRFVITSSRSGELANDTDLRNHASLFTHHLVEGMVHGAEDRDGDGVVNLSELYDYVHQALTANGRQVPQKRFEGDGDVPIALRTTSSAAHPRPELLDPVLVAPLLDVPTTEVDLGEVDADVVLPPERIAVVNRGGGTLEWTYESSAPWVTAERADSDLMLRLTPGPGPNRANVYIRDSLTGALKTVRISVRVRPSAPDTTRAEPQVPAPTPATVAPPIAAPVMKVEVPPRLPAPKPPVTDTPAGEPPAAETPDLGPPPTETPVIEAPATGTLVTDAPVTEPPAAGTRVAQTPVESPDPVAAEQVDPTEPEPVAPSPMPPGPRAKKSGEGTARSRWPVFGAATLSIAAGALTVLSSLDASSAIWDYTGTTRLILRDKDVAGLLWEILTGTVVALGGVLALRRRPNLGLGIAMAAAVPLGIDRLGWHTTAMSGSECQCVGASNVFAFRGAAVVCLLAATGCAVALTVRRAWTRHSWMPPALLGVALALVALWALVATRNFYREYGTPFGSYTVGTSSTWFVLVAVAVAAGVVASSKLERVAGIGALTGAVAMPVSAGVAEIAYVISVAGSEGYSVWRFWPWPLVTALLMALLVVSARRHRSAS